MKKGDAKTGLLLAVVANALVLGVWLFGGLLDAADGDRYYRAVQEDEYLEWLSFWAFLLAAVVYAAVAVRERRAGRPLPWWSAGLALFCFLVAMEEISWGQRLLGYRPPSYFLAHNFQQELNVHNVLDTGLRKLGLKAVILGFGVALPLLARGGLGRRLERLGVTAPPRALAPAFVATFALYQIYPWSHSGEWVELMLGLAFLFAALAAFAASGPAPLAAPRLRPLLATLAALALLGAATTAWSRHERSVHPGTLDAARAEVAALADDFTSGRARSRCGRHKRLYTFVEAYPRAGKGLTSGAFAQLVEQGLPEERAQFFLDPWNSPYWLRDKCTEKRDHRVTFVYSFGPNRRRDSNDWEIGGDDVGVVIRDVRAPR